MERTLVLNASYEPLAIIPAQDAMTLWAKDRVVVLEEHPREARAVNFTFHWPSVVRLKAYKKIKQRPTVQFTRPNVYARDQFECQYCLQPFDPEDLTFDHVVPAAHGGTRSWTNIVTACAACNRKKGSRTPAEAGMRDQHPRRPVVLTPGMTLTTYYRTPEAWRPYLHPKAAEPDADGFTVATADSSPDRARLVSAPA